MANETGGFIDLQVNGYAGVDFNSADLDAESLHHACQRLAADGVAGCLAAVITDTIDAMADRLTTIVRIREEDELVRQVILGFHIEGPFLNETPGFAGAHPAKMMRRANLDDMHRLLDAASGLTRIVTLAPERDIDRKVTRFLAGQGITVSAGHTDASFDELRAAIDAGLSMATHLGNGCPVHLHRHDNIVQRVLSLRQYLTFCFIADGAHVPFPALRNYLDLVGVERSIVVTDAMPAAAMPPGTYQLGHLTVQVGDDMVARIPGSMNLAGSAITMAQIRQNLLSNVGLSRDEAFLLTRDNPARAIRFGCD